MKAKGAFNGISITHPDHSNCRIPPARIALTMTTTSQQEVLFRFDCGPSIGMGHAVRCLAVASTLSKFGVRCTIAHSESSTDYLPCHLLHGMKTLAIPDGKELLEFLPLVSEPVPNILVIDHYGEARRNLSAAIFKDTNKVLFDDFKTYTDLPCDILINPNTKSGQTDSPSYRCLLGPRYAPIRDEIHQMASQWTPAFQADTEDVCLISIGATDPLNLTSSIMQALAQNPERHKFEFVIVLSSSAPHLEDVKALCTSLASELRVNLLVDAENMGALYLQAHCCIGAAGSSAWERCCVGLPTAQLVVADNQLHIQEELRAMGAIVNLPLPDDRQFFNVISDFLGSAARRDSAFLSLSNCSKKVVDGRGAQRIAQAISGKIS